MKFHYKGKYSGDPESLPHREHIPGAVKFREAEDMKRLSLIANGLSIVIFVVLALLATPRCGKYILQSSYALLVGCAISLLTLFPHELLHALCFKEDVYMYTNLSSGMMFVVGPETMSRARFVFMSLLPNLVFGIIPYALGLIFPKLVFLTVLGTLCVGMGAGDYINIFNALTQMPRGARTYMHGFHSYWYMP